MKRTVSLLLALGVALSPFLVIHGSVAAPPDRQSAPAPKRLRLPVVSKNARGLSIVLGSTNISNGLWMDTGGDVDTQAVNLSGVTARKTGNGAALPSPDGNTIGDHFIQFRADDSVIFQGAPTTRVRILVEYYDNGTDTFVIDYDGVSGGAFGDGRFLSAGIVHKTNTRQWRTVSFLIHVAVPLHGCGSARMRRVALPPDSLLVCNHPRARRAHVGGAIWNPS
jgi:hypothetical protein